MLAAACEGKSVLVTKTRPIRIADLRKLGFKVWKEVDAENLSDLDALRVKLEAAVKKQDAAIAKMEAAVSKWVHCLIERPMKRDLEREMTRLLRAYGFESVSDLFDDEAFELLYHPQVGEIISSAIESGEIREWLGYQHHVKSIDATLAHVRRCQSERENIQAKLQPIQSDLLRVDQELTTEAELLSTSPPFKISWPEDDDVEPWDQKALLSASSLTWIAGPGQLMLELLEALIADAANKMGKSITTDVRYTNRHGHMVTKPNLEIVHFPPADDLNQILSVVGWKPDISSNPNQDYSLTLRW